MPLIPLNIPAGQYRNGTDYQQSGRWRDVNLVRWHEGTMRPVGGWRQFGSVDINGTARSMLGWIDNSDTSRVAFGTHNKLYEMQGTTLSDITPAGLSAGIVDADANTGFGGNFYGSFAYGVERPSTSYIAPATQWSLDNWGEYLVACSPDDGKLYEWDLVASTASQISNSPTSCRGLMVTEERFLFALGAGGNPRLVQWSDQEDNTTWTPAATNQAGDLELQTNGLILTAIRARGQTLILTDQDAHAATYQGPPFVYGIERVGTSCGAISAKAAAATDSGVVWMGRNGFFAYSGGGVQELPSDVSDYVFSDMNSDQSSKVSCVPNSKWNEIWWFYPSADSTECNRYVAFDYGEGIWHTGSINRTAGIDEGTFRKPLWVQSDGELYEQEVGYDYGGATPFAETGPISLGSGDNIMNVVELISDEKTQGDVQAKFKTRYYPNSAESEYGPFSMSNPTSVRFQGRQVRMRVEGNVATDWRVGIMRLDARQGGRR